ATFRDPGNPTPGANEDAADYSASIAWGDGNTTPGIITNNGDGTWTVRGSHTYVGDTINGESEGVATITVTISHDATTPQVVTDTATITDPAVVPTGGFTFNAVEGSLSASQTVATFTDPGGPEALTDYAASIDWGDGSSSAGTITVSGGVFTVKGSHTYAEEGTRTITT